MLVRTQCYTKKITPSKNMHEEEEEIDDDIDCDALEKKMMRSLDKEK